jgi:hypothetical protein
MPTVHAATAQVSPAVSCASGYVEVYNEDHLYLKSNGIGNGVSANTLSGSCWKGGAAKSYGELKDSADGGCLAWNSSLGLVVVQTCTGATWQEWYPSGGSPGFYSNHWAQINTPSSAQLTANADENGTNVGLTGVINNLSSWYA